MLADAKRVIPFKTRIEMWLFLIFFWNSCFGLDPSVVITNIEKLYERGDLDIRARSKLFLRSKFPYDLYHSDMHLDESVNANNEKAFALNDSLSYFKGVDAPFKFSTDVPHQSSTPFLNLDGYISFLQSNPLHRRVEYAGDEICGNDYQELFGYRISQIYTFPGLPFEVPCLTCLKNLTGSLATVYINWINDLIPSTVTNFHEEPTRSWTFDSALFSLLTLDSHLLGGYRNVYHALMQLFSYSYVNFSPLLDERGGRLQVLPLHLLLKEFGNKDIPEDFSEMFYGGKMHFRCLVDVDNNYMDTGVMVKVDRIKNGKMNHQRFETWDSNYIPYEDVERNIKIDISWEKFGCCSACCCSHELCGLYASMKNCKSVFSKKIRKGYLSIKKLETKRKVLPENLNNVFSVSPYTDEGIPLYSTVLDSLRIPAIIESWKSSFNNINKISSYKGMGVYIEEKSCSNDRQKLDCFELAKCKKILLKTEEDEKTKLEGTDNDPCAELNITSIIIKEGQSLYRVREGENYRIQLDPLIFNTDQGVKWKISLDFVPNYRSKQDCSEQDRSVHPNGKDLLLLGLSRRDMNKRIEASTLDGMKARFELKSVMGNTDDGWKTFTVVIWAALIIIFFSFIMMFVIVIEGTKTKRIKRILHHKSEEAKEEKC